MKKFDMDDADLNSASAQLNIRLDSLNSEREQLLSKIFNNCLLVFAKNETKPTSGLIGTLENDKGINHYQKLLDQLKIHNLGDKLKDKLNRNQTIYNDSILVQQFFDDELLCVAYECNTIEFDIFMSVFDLKLNELCANRLDMGQCEEFMLTKMKSWAILCFAKNNKDDQSEADSEDENFFASSLLKLNLNLITVKQINVKYEIKAVETFDSSIFCLSAFDFVNRLVYGNDMNLVQIMSVGQHEDLTKPYFISSSFRKMKVCELYFVFLDGKQVDYSNIVYEPVQWDGGEKVQL